VTGNVVTAGYLTTTGFVVTGGYLPTAATPAQPRPPTYISDVYRGTVTVAGGGSRTVTVSGSAGG